MNIVVIGYYGYQNVGDDTLLRQTIARIRLSFPHATIQVLVGPHRDPQVKGVEWVPRLGWSALVAVMEADWVVVGGGGIFQDRTSIRSLVAYVGVLAVATGRIELWGQGMSPLRWWGSRWLVRWCLGRASLIECRDEGSMATVRGLVTERGMGRVRLGADLAWGVPVPMGVATKPRLSVGERWRVGVSLRPLPEGEWCGHVGEWGDGYDWLGWVFQPRDGGVLRGSGVTDMARIAFPLSDPMPQVVVAMRYHAGVMAALNGIPFVALGYDEKVSSLARELGQPLIEVVGGKADGVKGALNELMSRYDWYRERLQEGVGEIKRRGEWVGGSPPKG